MISKEQTEYYRKQLKKGAPDGELKEQMKKEGFSKEDTETVFMPHHYDMRNWYLFFGVVICLLGIYLFLQTGGLLILILGSLLFVAYYYEVKRLERLKNLK